MKNAASQAKSPSEINTWYDADELRWAARHWAVRIGVKTPQIHLRPMRTKWASISTSGRMTLNTDLLDLPKELGEFVIVHELVHLLVPNHGRVFKSFMYAYMPDWETRERHLQAHASETTKKHRKSLNIRKLM
jgi:predicted metal-dependent hydrolase